MAKRRKRSLGGTPEQHGERAQSWLRSAENNMSRRGQSARTACGDIGHYTDVVAEAQVAVIEASHAGDKATETRAENLLIRATKAQRAALKRCVRTERAQAIAGQPSRFDPGDD